MRGAYLEVLADLLGSIGVLLAGAVTLTTGWAYADPLVAIAIGLFVVPRAIGLGRQAVRILVQAAPAHVDLPRVRAELAALAGVRDVHDVHVWTLTSGMEVGTAHLSIDADIDPGRGAVGGAPPARRRPRAAALHGAGRTAGDGPALRRAGLVSSYRGPYMINPTPARQTAAPR